MASSLQKVFVYVVLQLICSTKCSWAHSCSPGGGHLHNIIIRPPPSPEPLSGNSTRRTCDRLSTLLYGCPDFRGLLLHDETVGPAQTYSSSTIHAWNRRAETVTITYNFRDQFVLTHVSMMFYYIPSLRSGLPNVTILRHTQSSGMSYMTAFNNALQNGRNEVIFSIPIAYDPTMRYRIILDFEGTDIEWIFLSELTFCSSPANDAFFPHGPPSMSPFPTRLLLPATSVHPNLTLSCTVRGDGKFNWQWSGPHHGMSHVTLSDLTRTSTAIFTQIAQNGPTTYQCMASYDPTLPGRNFSMSSSQSIEVIFESQLDYLTGINEALFQTNVKLECEIYGYLELNTPSISWTFNNTPINPENNPFFIIIERPGRRFLQDGGNTVRPSVISELHFFANDKQFFTGIYVCVHLTSVHTIHLSIVMERSPTTPSAQTVSTTLASEITTIESVLLTIEEVTGLFTLVLSILLSILLLVVTVLLSVACYYCNKFRRYSAATVAESQS